MLDGGGHSADCEGWQAAPITITGATLARGAPVMLFPTRIVGGGVFGYPV
jgi:hypothetical protein